MTNKAIKDKMREYYIRFIESNGEDDSYNELYNSIRNLVYAGLLDRKVLDMIYNYDTVLFVENGR